jgi:FolB domain-containing protein
MFTLRIAELEVFYRVGVPEEERANPQRLLVTVEMEVNAPHAAASDDLVDTIDYFSVSQDLMKYGEGRSWKLLEKLSAELSEMILAKYRPASVRVEIRKFIIPEARHVSVSCSRSRSR